MPRGLLRGVDVSAEGRLSRWERSGMRRGRQGIADFSPQPSPRGRIARLCIPQRLLGRPAALHPVIRGTSRNRAGTAATVGRRCLVESVPAGAPRAAGDASTDRDRCCRDVLEFRRAVAGLPESAARETSPQDHCLDRLASARLIRRKLARGADPSREIKLAFSVRGPQFPRAQQSRARE